MKKPAKRFKIMHEGRGGWCEWVCPEDKYQLKCCDCGLVHDVQFRTYVQTGRGQQRGTFTVAILPRQIRTMFRARRARKQ